MKNWFSYFKSSRYVTKTGILVALLFVVGLTTAFFKFGDSAFQFADGFYFALICLIPGPMMMVVGLVYPLLFDLLNGGFIFIPISLLVHFLMFIFIKLLQKPLTSYGSMMIGGLMLFFYVLYIYLINLNLGFDVARSIALKELIVDAIQYSISLLIGFILYFSLSKPKIKKIFN